jgi:hypothetical protein
MEKQLEEAVQNAEHLGGGLYRITDPEAIKNLPCQQLQPGQGFQSYGQLSQGPDKSK